MLSNEEKRRRYDQFGHAGVGGAGQGGFGGGMSMDDIFSQFGDIFGSFGGFSGFGGFGGGRSARRDNRGTNLRVKVKMNLQEIATGIEKKIKVKKYVACQHCNGTGAKDGKSYSTCSTCKGSGQVTPGYKIRYWERCKPLPRVRLARAKERLSMKNVLSVMGRAC